MSDFLLKGYSQNINDGLTNEFVVFQDRKWERITYPLTTNLCTQSNNH